MSEELKPCPFCSGEAEYSKVEKWESIPYGHEYHFVTCKNHCLEGLYARENTKEDTIRAWNRRPSPWHTETPTEEGDYCLAFRFGELADVEYCTGYWDGKAWDAFNDDDEWKDCYVILAWQKIEQYKEDEE